MREIEIKVKVKDIEALRAELVKRSCVLREPVEQHDTIYTGGNTDVWEKPIEGQIVMRIRRQPTGAKFTLKRQLSNELDNIEHEVKIDDPDTFHKILGELGFKPMVEVKKVRQRGKLGDYEICVDRVEQLGDFVELEKMTDEDVDRVMIEKQLFAELEPFGISRTDQVTNGYDTLIYRLEKSKTG